MISFWDAIGGMAVIMALSAVIKGAKWFWLYRLVKRSVGDIKLPNINLGGVKDGERSKSGEMGV